MKQMKDLIINSCRVQESIQEEGELPSQIPEVSGERVIQLNDKAQRIQEHYVNLGQIKEEFGHRHEELFLNRQTFIVANTQLEEMAQQHKTVRIHEIKKAISKAIAGDAKRRSLAGDPAAKLRAALKEELGRMVSLMDQIKLQRELDAQMVIHRRDEAIRGLRPAYEELDAANRE